jgi:hypothetical protein
MGGVTRLHDSTVVSLDERCRAASEAYDIAAQSLDSGLRREGGATATEWKAEFDARIELRLARAAFIARSKSFAAASEAELRARQRAHSDY